MQSCLRTQMEQNMIDQEFRGRVQGAYTFSSILWSQEDRDMEGGHIDKENHQVTFGKMERMLTLV